ncbi:VanZ family protein [Aromatoleum aromaticum]|uniref:VanZ-like domain-containing protein n=1 Tax=Aromatoleum aromaticum (strain DSM 19018 / LMG 30748 / EbN1) TaxID=76114 RepID=Q5NZK0_AROAE|nr:VanZ family protein [Aromatoleum aromaticum]NMG56861.1 VanZ family protein [Aromatoleum aromaticum]CAI09514.1 hypothetical protein ebD104 [Aromatoleum aromaticum EbN1]
MRSALFAAACLAVAVLSLLPGTALPPVAFNVWDKAQHAGAFAALAVLGLWAFPRWPVAVVGALLVYGVFIELAQDATGWRYGDWHDWLADAVGVTLGFMAWRCGAWFSCSAGAPAVR